MPFYPGHNLNEGDLVKITRPDGSVIFVKITAIPQTVDGTAAAGITDTITLDISNPREINSCAGK